MITVDIISFDPRQTFQFVNLHFLLLSLQSSVWRRSKTLSKEAILAAAASRRAEIATSVSHPSSVTKVGVEVSNKNEVMR